MILESIDGYFLPVNDFCLTGAEVQTAGKLSHHHYVKAFFSDGLFKRTGVFEFRIKVCRSQITEQSQRLTELQKSCFRALIRGKFIPLGNSDFSSYGTHKYCVCTFTLFYSFICKGDSVGIYGTTAHKYLFEGEVVAVNISHLFKYLLCFPDYFRSYSVSGNGYDLVIHRCFPLYELI